MMPSPFSDAAPTYAPEVWSALQALRARYQQDADLELWTEHELAYLHFLRWLAQTGRLVDDGVPAADGVWATGR